MKLNLESTKNRLFRWVSLAGYLLILLFVAGAVQAKSTLTWTEAFTLIEAKFPGVPTINMPTFQQWLNEDPHLLIIDVRKAKEFKISRIPGAVNETRLGRIRDLLKKSNKKAVLYCSVGYRSAKLVEKLKADGFNQVYNLKGSLFEWANQGNRVENDQGDTPFVHPYNERWGQLLDAARHPPK
jgi:rhodanese-related sulfurtransferase